MSPKPKASTPCQRPSECTSPKIPSWCDHRTTVSSCQPFPGCVAMRIQPTQTSTGTKASRKVPGDTRTPWPFVQPPITCESATTSPAAATSPSDSQKCVTVWTPTSVASHSSTPASPADSAVASPRVASYSPYLRISGKRSEPLSGCGLFEPLTGALFERQAPGVEPGRPQLGPEFLDRRVEIVREDVLHHADLAVVVEGHVDVLV